MCGSFSHRGPHQLKVITDVVIVSLIRVLRSSREGIEGWTSEALTSEALGLKGSKASLASVLRSSRAAQTHRPTFNPFHLSCACFFHQSNVITDMVIVSQIRVLRSLIHESREPRGAMGSPGDAAACAASILYSYTCRRRVCAARATGPRRGCGGYGL
jgi:hypothetical protein